MTTAVITPELLRQQLGRILQREPDGRIVGIQATSPWQGKDRIRIRNTDFQVVWCPSVLAVREQLAANENGQEPLVILTNQLERKLGVDVLGRLVSQKLYKIDRWRLLEEAFQADRLDPRLTEDEWLAEELLACAPVEGFRPVSSGFLDADTAWATYLSRRLGFPEGRTELTSVLEWSIDPNRLAELASAPDEVREGVVRRIGETTGIAGRAVGKLLEEGRGADALPLGLAISVLFAPTHEDEESRRTAAVRLEGLLGGMELDPGAARRWAEASESLLSSFDTRGSDVVPKLLARGDALLRELKAIEHTHLSDFLPEGLLQRMEWFAARIRRAVDRRSEAGSLEDAEVAAQELLRHRGLQGRSREGVGHAMKLLRAIGATEGATATSFLEATRNYSQHGSFMDCLREALHGTETNPALAAAYKELLELTDATRHRFAREFGARVPGWFSAGSDSAELVPLEAILEDVLAPVAAADRVLFVVVDGLSLPVFHRLQDDILWRGWTPIAPVEAPPHRLGLTLLPSVTHVCRASLLTGAPKAGSQSTEKKGFESHSALRARSKGGSPPKLFHKDQVRSDAGGALSEALQREIQNSQRRIVGVVVNAVDDYLQNSEQLRTDWDLDAIQPLGALLEAATTSERTVVLAADHGHVPERGLDLIEGVEGGDRHRRANGETRKGEVLVEGPRVLTESHRVVVPWSERIRYGKRKTGYHGGASPQEMLVPISVLTKGEPPDGWTEVPVYRPEWWIGPTIVRDESESLEDLSPTLVEQPEEGDQKTLFPPAGATEEPTSATWIDRLFESEVYAEQRALSGRTAPPEATVRQFLSALDERDGAATRLALSQVLQRPQQSVDSLVGAIERLLNVEGYETIAFDREAGQVRLNRTLLKEQFQLS